MNIEERLKESINQSVNSGILWSQWSFDKALLTRSLNVISALFPHYSLHESSHSNSIISEIEKILGSNIENLSFVDVWLILEASYWHDIGMIITYEEKEKLIKEPGFVNFLNQLSFEKNDLSDYANTFIEYTKGNVCSDFIKLEKSFIIVLAEYVRKEHPEKGKEILLNPTSIGIKSPATGLINSRLFLILADIIECHGKPFENILDLPFENDGLDVFDTAHPRFIACLLRIGDLLDIEDGRHCPTLLKTIGNLPQLSLAHFEKHRSIINKNVNENYIEIVAKCKNFESFEAQNDWFSLIQQEFSNQDKNWGEIAPQKILWKLPNLKKLKCELEGCISIENISNRLTMDNNRIHEYISGSTLYGNKLSCIDEILQNSIDATIDRIWLEHNKQIKTIDDYRNIAKLDKYRIDIIIDTPVDISDTDIMYKIEIKDNGKGMSLNDIKSLMNIASEKARIAKVKNRLGMPDWMRPSGYFGIGLQSIFAATDNFKIKTRHPNDSNYEIIIKKTTGKTPSFIIKKAEEIEWNFGTSIIFSIETPKIPDTVSGSPLPSKKLHQFDPLCDNILGSTEAVIIEKIEKFAQFTEIKIYYNNQLCNSKEDEENKLMITDIENGLEYCLEFYLSSERNTWHYRGRYAENHFFIDCVGIWGNIISGSADKYLTLDRQKFHQSGCNKLINLITKSIADKKEDILKKISNKKEASLYYFLHNNDTNNIWRTLKFSGVTVDELIRPGSCFYLALNFHEKGDIKIDDKKVIITNEKWEASKLVNIIAKTKLGVKVKKIINSKFTSNIYPVESITSIYDIEIADSIMLSTISDEAVQYLSSQKLSNIRTRYWLPYGNDKYHNITLKNECLDNYPWMLQLTGITALFPRGIILHSTQKTLDEDFDTLTLTIKKEKELNGENISESSIRDSLYEFYKEFPFLSREDPTISHLMKKHN